MLKFSQKLTSILVALCLLWAFQGPSFAKAKSVFSGQIAADFGSQEHEDNCDKELKFGNNSSSEFSFTLYQIQMLVPYSILPHADFSPSVPTSPPNA